MKTGNYTKFQQSVWDILKKIPKGKVSTYLDVASALGKSSAVRAVGNAVGKNPFAPKVPCHRVVKSDGRLGGYSGKGGLRTKRNLLKKEGVEIRERKIADFAEKRYDFK